MEVIFSMVDKLYDLQNGYKFYLKIRRNIAVIRGDSATGKSFIFSQIKALQAWNDDPNCTDKFDEFLIVNTDEGVLLFLQSEVHDKIIAIDRYDFFASKYPELSDKAVQSCKNNHVIICGRGCAPQNIARNNDYGILVYNTDKKRFRIRYLFSMDDLLTED